MSTICDRIKELRLSLGLNQTAFAARINQSPSSVSLYESGARIPKAPIVSLICSVFGVSRVWLEEGVGDMYAPSDDQAMQALTKILTGDDYTARATLLALANMPPDFWRLVREMVDYIAATTPPETPADPEQ